MVVPFVRSQKWQYSKFMYLLIAASALLISGLTWQVARVNVEPSHSTLALFLIKMTVVIPEIGIWLLAARSAKRFKRYALSIRSEADGHNLNIVANGLLWLVAYVVVICTLSPVQTLIPRTSHKYAFTALTNHLPLVFALLAASLVFKGSRGLAKLTRSEFWTRSRTMLLLLPFGLAMSLFIVNFYAEAPHLHDINGNLRFALPVQALLFTYVLPHVIVWLLGMLAGINLWWYTRQVDGELYKAIFRKTQRGIAIVFTSIFFAQLLITSPYAADNFQLGITLVYGVLILTILGYSLIYRGTRQLQNIEDVV